MSSSFKAAINSPGKPLMNMRVTDQLRLYNKITRRVLDIALAAGVVFTKIKDSDATAVDAGALSRKPVGSSVYEVNVPLLSDAGVLVPTTYQTIVADNTLSNPMYTVKEETPIRHVRVLDALSIPKTIQAGTFLVRNTDPRYGGTYIFRDKRGVYYTADIDGAIPFSEAFASEIGDVVSYNFPRNELPPDSPWLKTVNFDPVKKPIATAIPKTPEKPGKPREPVPEPVPEGWVPPPPPETPVGQTYGSPPPRPQPAPRLGGRRTRRNRRRNRRSRK